jgi:hypothetical protein
MFLHDRPLVVKPASTPWPLLPKQTWRDSLPADMLLSAVSTLVVALPSSEILKPLMNYPVYIKKIRCLKHGNHFHNSHSVMKYHK